MILITGESYTECFQSVIYRANMIIQNSSGSSFSRPSTVPPRQKIQTMDRRRLKGTSEGTASELFNSKQHSEYQFFAGVSPSHIWLCSL